MTTAIEQTAEEQAQSSMNKMKTKIRHQRVVAGGSAVGQYLKTNRKFRSIPPPDATLVRHGGLKSRLRYQTQRAVDDAHEIIAAVETTTGAVDEAINMSRSSLQPNASNSLTR
jgi:hypothetical protein